MTDSDAALSRALVRWSLAASRHARSVIAVLGVLTVAALVYAALGLGIDSDHTRMVRDSVPSMRAQKAFAELFPILDNALIVVIDGDSPGRARDAADALAERLRQRSDLFQHIFEPGGGPFFERNGLLYRSVPEIETLSDQLARMQPLIAELEVDPSLGTVSRLIQLGLDRAREEERAGVDWSVVLDKVGQAAVSVYAEYPVSVSWEDLFLRGSALETNTRRVLMVEPVLDFDSILPAAAPVQGIRQIARDLGLGPERAVTVRVTGNPALNLDEMIGLAWDIGVSGVFCFALVAWVVWLALRSWRLVTAALVTLISGLLWTAAFAAAAVGRLNVVSICFAVLFIGLGIDFAIHLGMEYAARRRRNADHEAALEGSVGVVGSSLTLCSVTTAIGFAAFIPTDYRAVAELGLISAAGMFIMLFMTLTLLPALLASVLALSDGAVGGVEKSPPGTGWVVRHARPILLAAPLVAVGAALLLMRATFDPNVVDMRDPETESVQAFADLLADNDVSSPWFANVLARDLEAAPELAARLEAMPEVKQAISLLDFVPDEQEEKRFILEDLAFLLEPPPMVEKVEPPSVSEQVKALRELRDFLHTRRESLHPTGGRTLLRSMTVLERELDRFLQRVAEEPEPDDALEQLEQLLLGGLGDQIARLRRMLDPEEVTLESLPYELIDRMLAPDGRARIQAFPSRDLGESGALYEFALAVREVAPDATGLAMNLVGFGEVTVASLREALATALTAISLLLLLLWRRLVPCVLVLAPLCLGALLTAGTAAGLGIPFNFANVIVIPLLLGIGVDSGIHLVHRVEFERLDVAGLLKTTTARAVFFSALTTIASFGTLSFSSHRGVASLGQLLVIGMLCTLLANLVFLPALLAIRSDGRSGEGA